MKKTQDVRGDGAFAIFGAYDEKLNTLAAESEAAHQRIQDAVLSLTERAEATQAKICNSQESIIRQIQDFGIALDDVRRLRSFERENPQILEIIQSLCAMPRTPEMYIGEENTKRLSRLLNLIEDLESATENKGLTFDYNTEGSLSAFDKVYAKDIREVKVMKPCIRREGTIVMKGMVLLPQSDAERSENQREFMVMEIQSSSN